MTPEWTNIILATVVAFVGIIGGIISYYDKRWRDHIERELAEHETRFTHAGQKMSDLTDQIQAWPGLWLRDYQRRDLCQTAHVDLERRGQHLEQWKDRANIRREGDHQ